jgi:hypothetical protein
MYLHVYLVKAGTHPDPLITQFDPQNSLYRRFPLVRRMKKPADKVKLLEQAKAASSQERDKAKNEDNEYTFYWYPELRLQLTNFDGPMDPFSLPSSMKKHIYVDPLSRQYYHPILFFNELWELKEKRIEIVGTDTRTLPLKLIFSATSLLKFQLCAHFDHALKQQESIYGESREFDDIKRMFLETSSWLIVVTAIVTLLHTVFDFLAFKNDVQFWRKQKDLSGLSVRSVLINTLFQFIIFMYLLDSETSYVVIASVGIGALIELWKITRAFKIKWHKSQSLPFLWVPSIEDRASYVKSKTRELDAVAVRYLTIASIPLLIGYSIYSLLHKEHKSWYSWILSSLVGFVYTFGFISMTPQLFINYKLKSVAHMPWKAFTYKALNTFIDDLFAFVIKMPWMHRIACFRDGKRGIPTNDLMLPFNLDVLFLVYLYQLWIYPVDRKRANEFGQTFNDDTDEAETEPKMVQKTAQGEPAFADVSSSSARKRRVPAK